MPPTPFPIVMASGIARFTFLRDYLVKQLGLLGLVDADSAFDGSDYFKGIKSYLREHGFKPYPSFVNFAGSANSRAVDLATSVEHALKDSGQPKAHIIAHSMGGLDARYMIVRHGMAEKVASLTTIGTPHLGSSVADWLVGNVGQFITKPLGWFFNDSGLNDSTRAACQAFNRESEAQESDNDVRYRTFWAAEDRSAIFFPLKIGYDILKKYEQDAGGDLNDGLATAQSQMWTRELHGTKKVKTVEQLPFPVPADHLNEIGWWDFGEFNTDNILELNPFKQARKFEQRIKDVYLEMAREL